MQGLHSSNEDPFGRLSRKSYRDGRRMPVGTATRGGVVDSSQWGSLSESADNTLNVEPRPLNLAEIQVLQTIARVRPSLKASTSARNETLEQLIGALVSATAAIETFQWEMASRDSAPLGVAKLDRANRPNELEGLRQLAGGWAGKDSVAPNRAALADAEQCFAMLTANSLGLPTVSASSGGDVLFYWSTPKGKASAAFEGDGFFGYTLFKDGRFRAGTEDGDLSGSALPDELIAYLKEIYGA